MQMDRLNSLDFESLETCKSYHMGKMTESLVFSKMELESNLLEVIHLMCAVQRVLRHVVDIVMFLLHR